MAFFDARRFLSLRFLADKNKEVFSLNRELAELAIIQPFLNNSLVITSPFLHGE
jgi:hypothetical protein